jgi:transposase
MNQEKKASYSGKKRYAIRGGRKGFDLHGNVLCQNCFSLSHELARLREENQRLKQTLKHRDQQLSEAKVTQKDVDNAHTPSSKRRHKRNSSVEDQAKMGGAKPGHPGSGRESISPEAAEEILRIPPPETCPDCEVALEPRDSRLRSVLEAEPLRAKKVLYRCSRGVCPQCLKTYTARATALPKSLYGNSLLAQAVTLHFFHGMTIGKVRTLLGEDVTESGLIDAFHRLGELFEKARPSLIEDYRHSQTKHADETGWRTDGKSGYAWLFSTSDTSIFEFRDTRSARVPKEILGESPLPGVLVVDRYAGYNRMPCALQYCYAHLLREVERLEEEYSDQAEVTRFVSEMATELTRAMKRSSKRARAGDLSKRSQRNSISNRETRRE